MVHIMKLYDSEFDRLKSGEKVREYRLYDEKRQLVNIGDTIKFVRLPNMDEDILVTVLNIEVFDNWRDCYSKYYEEDFSTLYESVDDVVLDTYNGYYTLEESLRYGSVVFTIEKVKSLRYK